MNRRVWPAFSLFSAPLDATLESGAAHKVVADFLPAVMEKPPADLFGVPIALRWITSGLLGIPRAPFRLFRRLPRYTFEKLTADRDTGDGQTVLTWDGRAMYAVAIQLGTMVDPRIVVEALDRSGGVIPGQRIEFTTANQKGLLRCPHIVALRITGRTHIKLVKGMTQAALANADQWQPMEVAGLPFKKADVPPEVYAGELQGFFAPQKSGHNAAVDRLTIAQLLHEPLPPTGIANIASPDWPPPDPGALLEHLRGGKPAMLEMIAACLSDSDDATPDRRQSDYRQRLIIPGLRQSDVAGAPPTDPVAMDAPVLDMTLLAVAGDSYAATALGFGTVDFPPSRPPNIHRGRVLPPGTAVEAFDYMATASFLLPLQGNVELAALSQMRPPPQPPGGLTAATHQSHRPAANDEAGNEAITLQWRSADQPQSYAVVHAADGRALVLNAPRNYSEGFVPFVPNRARAADGVLPPDATDRFIAPVTPLPLKGTKTVHYLVAGHDPFGRWSGFGLTTHTARSLPVLKPGLHLVRLDAVDGAKDRTRVAATLEIEFSWDWTDRTPQHIEFTGGFYPAGAGKVPAFSTHLALEAGETGTTPVQIGFELTGKPFLLSNHQGDVIEIQSKDADSHPAGLPVDSQRRRYRLTLQGLTCDFGAANELSYGVYARAFEQVRPTEASERVGPATTHLFDPVSPSVPDLLSDLHWTALPDASGRARGMLEWPACEGAVGYVVWEATEMALRNAMEPNFTPPPAAVPAPERAAQILALRSATPGGESRSLSAFTRLRPQLVQETSVEVELPASANVVYAYRVSAVSTSNVASDRSEMIFLAVPRRNVPGRPTLVLRAAANGIRVIALPGKGITPSGYQIFRVHSPSLLSSVGVKGPPKISAHDPRWSPHTIPGLHLPDQNGMAVVDPVTPDWRPYYYQAVAVSTDRPERGELGGESPASAVQSMVAPPPGPPQLELLQDQAQGTLRVVRVTTDLPRRRSPLGEATVTVRYSDDGVLSRTIVHTDRLPYSDESLHMDAASTGGLTTLHLSLPAHLALHSLTATDPLNRTTQLTFEVT